jgi:photosystem II stability/assembly factor-like uncharacterized protein
MHFADLLWQSSLVRGLHGKVTVRNFLTITLAAGLVVTATVASSGQSRPQLQISHTTESLRGVSIVSRKIVWASGTHGTYLRTTDGGLIWTPEQVPGAENLDFRAVVAFSADEAFLMAAGPGDQSRIYHTSDTGRHWELQYQNTNPKGFFDAMVFWDPAHGIVLGDPIPDETGNLKFELLTTSDGHNWSAIPASQIPPAVEGEGAFAASNSCIAIVRSAGAEPKSVAREGTNGKGTTSSRAISASEKDGASAPEAPAAPDPNIWFATGGKAARVFHSPDRGQTWEVFQTPIIHGPDSAGIFSIAFRDPTHGVIAGGDYKHPEQDGPNLAFADDGGKTWTLSKIYPQQYYSAAAYDHKRDPGHPRLFIVGPKFIYDFRPPRNPTRISASKKSDSGFNAVATYPAGGALVVGPKGTIAFVP